MKKDEPAAPSARAELRAAKWTGARTFTIKLWAYLLPGMSKSATTEVDVWLQDTEERRTNALVRALHGSCGERRKLKLLCRRFPVCV